MGYDQMAVSHQLSAVAKTGSINQNKVFNSTIFDLPCTPHLVFMEDLLHELPWHMADSHHLIPHTPYLTPIHGTRHAYITKM